MSAVTDLSPAEVFGRKLIDVYNHAALTLMIAVGHRVGMFDRLAGQPPATSVEIAAKWGLSERYVREWLGAMAVGGIVEYDSERGTFYLPDAHAECLIRAASPNNLAVMAQWIAVLGSAEDAVVGAFTHGRGVPYSAYHRFHEVMAEESGQTTVAALEEHILPAVPGLIGRLQTGIDVLDVGCGSGFALIRMAELYPASRFVGYDISPTAIHRAQAMTNRNRLANVRFEVVDVAEMKDREAFDLVTAFDAIHDQPRPADVLANVRAALRTDGIFLMQDIGSCSHLGGNLDHPLGPFLYTVSCMHCMSVSLAGGGPGLGATWGQQVALRMLAEAGFTEIRVETLPHDLLNEYFIAR